MGPGTGTADSAHRAAPGALLAGHWLHTHRLALRRFTPADLDWLASLYRDPDVTRYLGGMKDRDATKRLLDARILQYYEQQPGLGIWMTVERDTRLAVGFHVLNHIQGDTTVQVGFTLVKSAWGHGYATEMGFALLRYGFIDLRLPRIAGIASLQNHASQRVLAKIGLRRNGEHTFVHPAYASEGQMAWFERDAADWLSEWSRAAGRGTPPGAALVNVE